MKHPVITTLFALSVSNALAQGTINFANLSTGVDAPVYSYRGFPLAGDQAWAQLWAGPGPDSLAPVGEAVLFETGSLAGYFLGGARVIDNVAPGDLAHVQVRVWETGYASFWLEAELNWSVGAFGEHGSLGTSDGIYYDGSPGPSSLLVTTGFDVASAANLVGLNSFSLGWSNVIPEPSIPALAIVGLVCGLLLRGRRSGR